MGLLRRLISPPFTDGENHIPDDVPQEAPTYGDSYSKTIEEYKNSNRKILNSYKD